MERSATFVFDGEALRPEGPTDLRPNARYQVRYEEIAEPSIPRETDSVWEFLKQMAGTVDAPPDWSIDHDHYIHGTPKRGEGPKQ